MIVCWYENLFLSISCRHQFQCSKAYVVTAPFQDNDLTESEKRNLKRMKSMCPNGNSW